MTLQPRSDAKNYEMAVDILNVCFFPNKDALSLFAKHDCSIFYVQLHFQSV